jgi:predicted secreted Zn-dependent protease
MKKVFLPFVILLLTSGAGSAADESFVIAPSIEQVFPSQKANGVLEPVVTERYEYYQITGKCEQDLQCELRDKGCEWKDGKTYDSMTTWQFKWEYDPVRSPGSCSVDSFRISVDIVFRYPEWMRDDDAPLMLVEKWNSYMQGLIAHETGHRDMAVEAARDLARMVAKLPPAADCTELERKVHTLCRLQMEKLNREAEAYDASTLHGGTQGAILE